MSPRISAQYVDSEESEGANDPDKTFRIEILKGFRAVEINT